MPNLDINITTTADTSGAAQSKAAVQGLTNEVKTGSTESENYHEKQKQIIEAMHMVSLMTGGEVREGMHETTLGLKLLGSLTGEMSAGILGIATVVGMAIPIVVGLFKEMYSAGGEEAKKFAEDNKSAATKAAEDLGTLDEKARLKTETIATNARNVSNAMVKLYTAVSEAEDKAAVSADKNAEKALTAHNLILNALGLRVNKMMDIYNLGLLHLKSIQDEAKMHADSLKNEVAKIDQEDENTRVERSALADKRAELINQLTKQREIRDVIREQNEAIERQSSIRSNKHQLADSVMEMITPSEPIGAVSRVAQNMVGWANDAIDERQVGKSKSMRDDSLTSAQSRVTSLEKDLETTNAEWEKSLTKSVELERKGEEKAGALKVNLDEIYKTEASDANLEKAKVLDQMGKQNAADSSSVLDHVTATTALDSRSVADARQAASDGNITAKELPRMIADMRSMLGSYQAGFMLMSGNSTENIRQMTQVIKNLEDQQSFSKTFNDRLEKVVLDGNQTRAKMAAMEYQMRIMTDKIPH